MSGGSGEAPRPPSDLASRNPLVVTIEKGELFHRFFSAKHDPIYFDASLSGRLNAPDGSYGVLYVAKAIDGAFAETFLREPGRTILPEDLLNAKAHVSLKATRDLRLARLSGKGLGILGATAQVLHGGLPYDIPQEWSKALHGHLDGFDGIAYNARHNDEELCYAIFDRAQAVIIEERRNTKLDDDWFWELAEQYRIGLAP